MKVKKLSKLLPPFTVRSRKYYRFQDDYLPPPPFFPPVLLLPHCVIKQNLKSYDNLSRLDMTLAFFEMEEVESATRTLLPHGMTGNSWLSS